MLHLFKNFLKNKKIAETNLESPVFECGPGYLTQGYGSFVGHPAPAILPDDPWFSKPIISDSGRDYMERETSIKISESNNVTTIKKEQKNMHQLMYDISVKSGKTTTQLNPIGGSENFQGGSENVFR
jgi:hypothetical protein